MGQNMRLVCPKCAAQYEVDGSVIPDAGRDVQCSNCSHTWWVLPEKAAAQEPYIATQADAVPPRVDDGDESTPDLDDSEWDEDVRAEADAPQATAIAEEQLDPRRRNLDNAVLDVLRQEAEREAVARKAEASGTPPQSKLDPSLGRGEGEREAAVQNRMAKMRGLSAPGVEIEDVTISGRAEGMKLPDVDEINSTLHGRDNHDDAVDTDSVGRAARRRRGGFRLGFTSMVVLSLAVIVAYSYADEIVARAPELETSVASLTRAVDAGRVWLDTAALNASEAIRGMTASE